MHATLKPHHFLDLICDMAANNGVFEYVSPYGHAMRVYGNLLSAGDIDSVTFTPGADDACKPCKMLSDGICTDVFTEEVAKNYGMDKKYDYNMKLDMTFVQILPEVFSFDTERNVDEVFTLLKEKLTPEIILMNWPRANRVELTLKGLDMVIEARSKKSIK